VVLPESQKPNSLAIAGFLAPFVAAGITGLLLLSLGEDLKPFKVSIAYLTITPLILLTGVVLSLKSIPLVEEFGDKDYAYSGLIFEYSFPNCLCHIFNLFLFLIPQSLNSSIYNVGLPR